MCRTRRAWLLIARSMMKIPKIPNALRPYGAAYQRIAALTRWSSAKSQKRLTFSCTISLNAAARRTSSAPIIIFRAGTFRSTPVTVEKVT